MPQESIQDRGMNTFWIYLSVSKMFFLHVNVFCYAKDNDIWLNMKINTLFSQHLVLQHFFSTPKTAPVLPT